LTGFRLTEAPDADIELSIPEVLPQDCDQNQEHGKQSHEIDPWAALIGLLHE
jgi:hypothetical protein